MPDITAEKLKEIVLRFLREQFHITQEQLQGLDFKVNLIQLGFVDSQGFVELVVFLEEETGVAIDFDDVDPEEFTTLDGLLRHVLKSANV